MVKPKPFRSWNPEPMGMLPSSPVVWLPANHLIFFLLDLAVELVLDLDEIYAPRKTVVEPVFGQIKGSRRLDRFLLRGLEQVNGEWALMATTHTILSLFRASLTTT